MTENEPHRVEVGIEFHGDPQRGRVVIEDALDLLMDRLTDHPALIDATVDATFPPSMRQPPEVPRIRWDGTEHRTTLRAIHPPQVTVECACGWTNTTSDERSAWVAVAEHRDQDCVMAPPDRGDL